MTMRHSYSELKTYVTCPKQWAALYRDRIVKRGPSPALDRGIKLHEELEKALAEPRMPDPAALPEGADKLPEGLFPYLLRLRQQEPQPSYRVTPEMALAMDVRGRGCKWDSPYVMLRGKIDVAIEQFDETLSPKGALHLDWKTGKVRPDSLQAKCYAVLAAAHGFPQVDFRWVYVEHGEVRKETVRGGDAWPEVKKVMDATENEGNDPVPKPSPLCRYCPVSWCAHNSNPEAE